MLWDRVRRRMAAAGVRQFEDYVARLSDPATGPAEWRRLEGEVTVGETYFLRYVEQFAALRGTILPEIIARNGAERRLRIWSAGCATGAEPYSIAILVAELLGERLPDWRVSILGTDINEDALAAARQATFGAWALRSLSAEQKSEWFTPEERRWRLKPRYRSLVRFQHGNLLDLLGAEAPLELVDFDLILCRNVLIYFHPDTVTAVVAALASRLNAEGWLLIGHAEPNPGLEAHARAVQLAGTLAYRRRDSLAPAPQPPPPAWTPPAPPEPAAAAPFVPPPRPARPPAAEPAEPSSPGAPAVDDIRRLADEGRLAEAEAACRTALERGADQAVLYFYMGLVEQGQGRLAEAEESLRKAAYLDGQFVMAHYHLGLVRLDRGRRESGRRALSAAARLAASLSPTARLCEGEGLTAGDLRELARLQLDATAGAR
ncbi:MAG: CheR family methyltransferase [Phenylobacterium sp.]|uniref:CheR family methyltransferase n=1 Tax=Phenylobacterium sp. TaxID=1871053 RepID=UPI00391A7106